MYSYYGQRKKSSCGKPTYCLCLLWGEKVKCRKITDVIENYVKTFINSEYCKEVESYPAGICLNCMKQVYKLKKSETASENIVKKWSLCKNTNCI